MAHILVTAKEAAARSAKAREEEIAYAFSIHLASIAEVIEKVASAGDNKANFPLGTISDRARRALQVELEEKGYVVTLRPGGHNGPSSWSITW